jgi:hypothetical protein
MLNDLIDELPSVPDKCYMVAILQAIINDKPIPAGDPALLKPYQLNRNDISELMATVGDPATNFEVSGENPESDVTSDRWRHFEILKGLATGKYSRVSDAAKAVGLSSSRVSEIIGRRVRIWCHPALYRWCFQIVQDDSFKGSKNWVVRLRDFDISPMMSTSLTYWDQEDTSPTYEHLTVGEAFVTIEKYLNTFGASLKVWIHKPHIPADAAIHEGRKARREARVDLDRTIVNDFKSSTLTIAQLSKKYNKDRGSLNNAFKRHLSAFTTDALQTSNVYMEFSWCTNLYEKGSYNLQYGKGRAVTSSGLKLRDALLLVDEINTRASNLDNRTDARAFHRVYVKDRYGAMPKEACLMGGTPTVVVKSLSNTQLKPGQMALLCELETGDQFKLPHSTGENIWVLDFIKKT